MNRKHKLKSDLLLCLGMVCLSMSLLAKQRPNVILIITDDQGYGDLGCTGNPHVKTPHIDAFAKESTRFTNFHVSPVCAPTRSSLMTGRYSLRTGVCDTYNGGAIMAANEVSLAEVLKQGDYATGIFGKWHLGDNYPSRPMDQGFDESVIHLAGGMGQPGDFTNYYKKNRSYFDPVLWHNGEKQAYKGYCSDIFTSEAISFIEQNKEEPFFCYLSFNAPHTPLQVPEEYYNRYKDIDPSLGFEKDDRPFPIMTERDKEAARKVYAMVSNIDDNLGKLFGTLEELNISENTIVIFMTDNGPEHSRYIAGMRGRKSDVFRGGVRVPFFLRYPSRFEGDREIESTTAHLDVLPTLAALCDVDLPKLKKIDGQSMVPMLEDAKFRPKERTLFSYWTRKSPELYNNVSVQQGRYKLVGRTDYEATINDFLLFDLKEDPYEQNNLVTNLPEVAVKLKKEMDNAYYELVSSPNFLNPPRITIGSAMENPVCLNTNDASGERGLWTQGAVYGKYDVDIKQGTYTVRFKFMKPMDGSGDMLVEANGLVFRKHGPGTEITEMEIKHITLPDLQGELIPTYLLKGKKIFPYVVEVEREK